jgi:uncharacterized membrane protein YeaQ/YmgE (transglycosylase-associated protein family)
LLWLLIAAVCGGIGRAIAGGTNGGCLVSIALGFIGAFFGSWLARQFHLPEPLMLDVGRHHFPVVWSIVGSALLVAVVHLISGGRRRGR